jgi:adenylate cyclase
MKRHNLFAELKRRNVIRMAGLYLVGAWLVIQVASTVLPTFDVPSWALRGLIITVAIGFIPALIFSWIFELTPQGLKRDEDVPPEQSIAPQTTLLIPLHGDPRYEALAEKIMPAREFHGSLK